MELLTVQETALMLRVTPVTIRRYIAAGRLPAVKVGRGVRVHREAAERFAEPLEPSPPPRHSSRIPKGTPTSADDPLWEIIGMIECDGPSDVSQNKHKYLADAYADLHE